MRMQRATPPPDGAPEQDPPPFDVLYRERIGYVAGALRRMGVADRHVEDAAHDVFCVVLRELPRYEPRGLFPAWLFDIATKVASEHRRRESRSPLAPEESAPSTDGTARVEAGAVANDLAVRIVSAIANDHRRRVFVLSHLDGRTVPEIAGLLRVPESTILSWLRAARREVEAAARRLGARESDRPSAVPLFAALPLLDVDRATRPLSESAADRIWARLQRAPELRAYHGEQGAAPTEGWARPVAGPHPRVGGRPDRCGRADRGQALGSAPPVRARAHRGDRRRRHRRAVHRRRRAAPPSRPPCRLPRLPRRPRPPPRAWRSTRRRISRPSAS